MSKKTKIILIIVAVFVFCGVIGVLFGEVEDDTTAPEEKTEIIKEEPKKEKPKEEKPKATEEDLIKRAKKSAKPALGDGDKLGKIKMKDKNLIINITINPDKGKLSDLSDKEYYALIAQSRFEDVTANILDNGKDMLDLWDQMTVKFGDAGKIVGTKGMLSDDKTYFDSSKTETGEFEITGSKIKDPTDDFDLATQNAYKSAQDYLNYSGFSKQGLIDQLSSEYGDEYTVEQATAAVQALEDEGKVDWNNEAVESAESYLEMQAFSRAGLIDQLSSSYGDKYTKEQAEYAADKVGL